MLQIDDGIVCSGKDQPSPHSWSISRAPGSPWEGCISSVGKS